MKRYLVLIILLSVNLSLLAQNQRWSIEKAKEWQTQNKWFCGMNYIPSNAINYTAMWDKTSFSPDLIEKEMKLAESIGLNCARVVLQYAVYEDDPKYFIKTFDKFLSICNKHGVKVMPCFFDDCTFGTNTDTKIGVQPEPLEGWYAWAWSPSPGYTMVVDEREHKKLEVYVKDMLNHFKNDERILLWDLYNEPTNTTMPERSMPLLKKVFAWAKEMDPLQPISVGMWNGNSELNDLIVANSDVITFHCYAPKDQTEEVMKEKLTYNRPVICTEWMNRVAKSKVEDILPLFYEYNVGSMVWGLVNGKTQTHLSWGHRPENLPYTGEWQHDLFTGEFVPYKASEIKLIKTLTGEK
ncbi:glycoside hydrolase family 2 TIM barrel-domain containing protein [Sunxiuqinia sp. A32]|uniref:glycoside hydrolase family 2 TIM barrel-domain containing protein n=1 Tax=Sunxiuqinia sp. A32 TaxID=3461496 RepID=UPI004045FDBC